MTLLLDIGAIVCATGLLVLALVAVVGGMTYLLDWLDRWSVR